MLKRLTVLMVLLAIFVLGVGCSQNDPLTGPGDSSNPYDRAKNGTEVLGAPSIAIAAGTGYAEGGVGMVGVNSAQLDVEVPAEAQIEQVLLYWAGASTDGTGDDEITLAGNPVRGELIGGPTRFFSINDVDYYFSAYRADITDLGGGLVSTGSNSLTVAGFDFATTPLDENNGASVLVIYRDGPDAILDLRDGLDMAFIGFQPTLDATVPQVFGVEVDDIARTAELMLIVASVGENRPNRIQVSTLAGDQLFYTLLGSFDGLSWDSMVLTIDVPAGVDELSVQLVSVDSGEPPGASLGWVAVGLAVDPVLEETFDIAGTVFVDADVDQTQASYELGIGNVVVELLDGTDPVATVTTGGDGTFLLTAPAGNYTVNIPYGLTPDDFNYDLAASFDPTSGLTAAVTVGPEALGLEFGFVPRPDDIIADIETGVLPSNALPIDYWLKVLRRTIIAENSGRQANGHGNGSHEGHEAWGHPGWYPSPEQMMGLIYQIEGLFLPEPYQFTDGNEVEEAYELLRRKQKTDLGKLLQEMLVTELNYAAGLGLISEDDRLGVLISWGEALVNINPDDGAKSGDKAFINDIRKAKLVFEAVNTGGGGGVDE